MTKYGLGAKLNTRNEGIQALTMESVANLPAKYGYRFQYEGQKFAPIDNQGQLGTCVSYGWRKRFDFQYNKDHPGAFQTCSPRAIYAAAKAQFEAGDVGDDGLAVSDGGNVLREFWVAESDWSSAMTQGEQDFSQWLEQAPVNLQRTDFLFANIVRLQEISVEQIKLMLFKHGPVVMGLNWPSNWFDIGQDGRLPSPAETAGGHCVGLTDWDDDFENLDGSKGALDLPNNWDTTWGDKGYAKVPYNVVPQLITDIYTIQLAA